MNKTMQLPPSVIDAALGPIPDDLCHALMAAGPRAAVAGGFLRTVGSQIFHSHRGCPEEAPKDIDVFVGSPGWIGAFSEPLLKGTDWVRYDRSCTIRREIPIKVIGEWTFEHPAELIDKFDFSVIQAAMWWNGSAWDGIATSSWHHDISCREACYFKGAPNPAGTLTRIARFAELGYTIPDWSIASIAVRATEQAQEHAAGFDMQPADALEQLLSSRVSPEVLDCSGMYAGYDVC